MAWAFHCGLSAPCFGQEERFGHEERLGQDEQAYSSELPEELEYWLAQTEQYQLGLMEAEELRRRLLLERVFDASGSDRDGQALSTTAALVAEGVTALQEQLASGEKTAFGIAAFDLSPERIESQLQGEIEFPAADQTFDAFDGRWFGRWETMPVNHDWRPSRVHEPKLSAERTPILIHADQFAWIHNGFGWNYLVSSASPEANPYVLGQVYYLNAQDLKQIDGRKPHVGFIDLPREQEGRVTRLVWITEREIFLEEVIAPTSTRGERYVITGIFHRLLEEPPTISEEAVQAIYTRHSQTRPEFQRFRWSPPRFR